MNARRILKKLDYLPRWAWYLISFFVVGPFGLLGVYLVFHVLEKMIQEQDAQQGSRPGGARRAAPAEDEYFVTSDEEILRQWQQTEASAARAHAQRQHAAQDIGEDADVSEVIRAGYDAMRRIRSANDIIEDEALSAQIDSIENSCSQILSILEQRPQLLTQLRTFLRYYLPTTLKLLDARARLENTASTPKAREVRARISEAVGVIDKAFLRQVEALDEYRFIDLESEMDVLSDMLRADGLIDDRKDDDPFSAVLSGRR